MAPVDPPRPSRPTPAASARDERYNVPGADILEHDTWADDPERCPSCEREVASSNSRCPHCGQWLERCARSCASCASPRCVGGQREKR